MKREWENPQIQSQGREVPRATLFPYPTEALALSGERTIAPLSSYSMVHGTLCIPRPAGAWKALSARI